MYIYIYIYTCIYILHMTYTHMQRHNMKIFTNHHLLEFDKPSLEQCKSFFAGIILGANIDMLTRTHAHMYAYVQIHSYVDTYMHACGT